MIAKAKKIAAHLLEASEDDIEFADGTFTVKGTDKGKAIQEVAWAAFTAHDYPEGMEPQPRLRRRRSTRRTSPSRTARTSRASRSTPRPGSVDLRKYVCVDDVGNVINPLIVEGQVHGGLAQGIAQALFEEANYDEQGTLVNGTFVDYTLPSAADLPSFDTAIVSTPATSNPLGVKGVGEAGTIASTPAIVNAVLDAVRQFGVKDIEMPTHLAARVAGHPGRQGPRHRGDAGRHPLAGCRAGLDRPEQPPGRGPVIPAKFDYVKPGSVEEAISALAEGGEDAKIIAGGQSLLPVLRLRLAAPTLLVDLGGIAELKRGPRRRRRHRRSAR